MVNMQISVWSEPGGRLVTEPLGQGQPNMVLDPGSYSIVVVCGVVSTVYTCVAQPPSTTMNHHQGNIEEV